MKDVSPVKDNLIGRVVGFEIPHQPHPSHIKPGRATRFKRTVWGRVVDMTDNHSHVFVDAGTGELYGCVTDNLHTIMPETY